MSAIISDLNSSQEPFHVARKYAVLYTPEELWSFIRMYAVYLRSPVRPTAENALRCIHLCEDALNIQNLDLEEGGEEEDAR